jgi:hypothetical protein
MSIKETVSPGEQVPVTPVAGKRQRFGMLPEDIAKRKDLTSSDKLAVTILNMESFGTGFVCISDAIFADAMGLSRPQALKSRKALEKRELIEKSGTPKDQMQTYRLLHPDMVGTGTAPKEIKTKRRITITPCRTEPRCLGCGAQRPIGTGGLCLLCRRQDLADLQVGKFVRENPGVSYEVVWAMFKAHGHKFSVKELKRAYAKFGQSVKLAV